MANPLLDINPIGVVGQVASFAERIKGRGKLKKARRLSKLNQQVLFAQQRRAFIRKAREAQALALVGGQATGADLSSSAVQGNLASLQTQEAVALGEQRDTTRRTREIGGLVESAQSGIAAGASFGKLTGAVTDFLGEFK